MNPIVLWSGKVHGEVFRVVCSAFVAKSPELKVSKQTTDDVGDLKWDRVSGPIEAQVIAHALWYSAAHLKAREEAAVASITGSGRPVTITAEDVAGAFPDLGERLDR